MYAHSKSLDTFILVHSYWTVTDTRELIHSTNATHVIIQHSGPGLYFLYYKDELLIDLQFSDADKLSSLADAQNLDIQEPTPTIDAFANPSGIRSMAVVLKNGEVFGVWDAQRPRGPHRGVSVARDFQADFPEEVHVDATATLKVSLAPPNPLEVSKGVQVELNEPVEVIILSDSAFRLAVGEESRKVMTVTDVDKTESVRFSFVAQTADVLGKIDVWLMQKGTRIGSTTVAAAIHLTSESVNSKLRKHIIAADEPPAEQSDLTLTILERRMDGEIQLEMIVNAEGIGSGTKIFKTENPLPEKGSAYFQNLFRDIQNLSGFTDEDSDKHLESKGLELFDIFPHDLQKLLWENQKRIKAVRIYSQEPSIPWELCRLSFEEDGDFKEGRFFCEAFAISRLLLSADPVSKLSMKKVGLIVPPDSGLQYAKDEKAYVQSLGSAVRTIDEIHPTPKTIMDAMASAEYDAWHFTGHGDFRDVDANLSRIRLENKAELRPENINGRVKNLGKANPIVFLNGCQVGRADRALTGIGGWANKFIEAGAGAFIGALWNINDETAFCFAKAFYEKLLAGETIGEATRQARLAVRKSGSSTWLAYTVFADPMTKLQM